MGPASPACALDTSKPSIRKAGMTVHLIRFSMIVSGLPWSGHAEQVSDAVLTHPAGPADPVDIVLGLIRDVVIDDVADPFDIDAPADDIGGDQNVNVPRRKPRITRSRAAWGRSPWIAATPEHRRNRSASRSAPALGAGEDDALAGFISFEQMKLKSSTLRCVIHRDEILLDGPPTAHPETG